MKKMKLLLGVAAAVFMLAVPASAKAIEVPAVSSYSGETVSAQAVKHGLIIKGNKITYWYKGRQAKNCWKKWKGNRYYFNQNGNAVRGGVRIKTGNTYVTYVLDENGRQITDKTNRMVTVNGNLYYITSKYGRAATGYFIYKNNLYYADPKGRCYKNRSRENGQLQFGSNGKAKRNYDALLKMRVMTIVSRITNSNMTKSEKLGACWNYVVSNFYYGGPDPNLNSTGWARSEALRMLSSGYGNCYGFSCTFAALAREVGYSPYMMCGRVPGSRDGAADGYTRHCWVRINGLYYDPEAQYAGWMRGVYGYSYYPISHQVQKVVSFNNH